jgi:hypothetical protein
LKGTSTFRDLVKGLFRSIVDSIIDALTKMATQYLETLLIQSIQSRIAGAQVIVVHAAEAGAAAFASTAAIPYVGPELAPAAAAEAYAATMAFQGLVAAAQGYDIPAGVDPVVQAHAQEMVLPKEHADMFRDMAANGGGGGGETHLHVHAIDTQGVKQFFQNNKRYAAEAVHSHLKSTGRAAPGH